MRPIVARVYVWVHGVDSALLHRERKQLTVFDRFDIVVRADPPLPPNRSVPGEARDEAIGLDDFAAFLTTIRRPNRQKVAVGEQCDSRPVLCLRIVESLENFAVHVHQNRQRLMLLVVEVVSRLNSRHVVVNNSTSGRTRGLFRKLEIPESTKTIDFAAVGRRNFGRHDLGWPWHIGGLVAAAT